MVDKAWTVLQRPVEWTCIDWFIFSNFGNVIKERLVRRYTSRIVEFNCRIYTAWEGRLGILEESHKTISNLFKYMEITIVILNFSWFYILKWLGILYISNKSTNFFILLIKISISYQQCY